MALRFDTKAFEKDLLARLKTNLGYAFDIWESDVYKHLKHPFYIVVNYPMKITSKLFFCSYTATSYIFISIDLFIFK